MMLNQIAWSERYEIVPSIDEQHKQIFALVVSLTHAIEECEKQEHDETCKQKALEWLHYLLEYTEGHMMFEEALMRETAFPYLEYHIQTHHRILQNLHHHYAEMVAGTLDPVDLLATLDHWARVHVLTEDMSFKKHFLSNNIR
jgi:hemerythrin